MQHADAVFTIYFYMLVSDSNTAEMELITTRFPERFPDCKGIDIMHSARELFMLLEQSPDAYLEKLESAITAIGRSADSRIKKKLFLSFESLAEVNEKINRGESALLKTLAAQWF
jgi:hypothetical protein